MREVLTIGWEDPHSALEETSGGGGSSCRGGEGAISISRVGCSGGRDEESGTSTESRLGIWDAVVIFISQTFWVTSLFCLRLSFVLLLYILPVRILYVLLLR